MRGYGAAMALRAFPVLYANDVESVAAFYAALGFEERFPRTTPARPASSPCAATRRSSA